MHKIICNTDIQMGENKHQKYAYRELSIYPIYQPLHSGRIWHKVNF